MVVFSIYEMQTLAADVKEVAANRLVKIHDFTVIASNQSTMARLARNVLLRAPGAPDNDPDIQRIQKLRAENREMVDELNKKLRREEDRQLLQVVIDNREKFNHGVDEALSLAKAGKRDEATQLLLGETRKIQQRMQNAAQDGVKLQQRQVPLVDSVADTPVINVEKTPPPSKAFSLARPQPRPALSLAATNAGKDWASF